MTVKKYAKFEKELTCQFKIDMRNLRILSQALETLKHIYLNGLLLTIVYNV